MEEHLIKKYTIFFGLAIVSLIIAFILIIVGITSNNQFWISGIFAIGGALAFLFSGIKVYKDKIRMFGENIEKEANDNKSIEHKMAKSIRRDAFRYYILGSVFEMDFIVHERYNDANIKEGFSWAIAIIDKAYDDILDLTNYDRKGSLNIYPGQNFIHLML